MNTRHNSYGMRMGVVHLTLSMQLGIFVPLSITSPESPSLLIRFWL